MKKPPQYHTCATLMRILLKLTEIGMTALFEWYVNACALKYEYHKYMCLCKRDWTMCSTYDTYYGLISQYNWGGGYMTN